jgi:type IV secretion system protein VirD4
LIAQSLNQIEKAYGPNNSILDNCHVRVAFASNDERTAKRISDALGTATELRAQRNYAGHRLAPWLGHLMVSRQETARPLLTPGEIMQLPPDDEIVMVSGHPPIRATKIRYYRDANFTHRILPPPLLTSGGYVDVPPSRADDWSSLAVPAAPLAPAVTVISSAAIDDGGLQQQPELVDVVEVPLRDEVPTDFALLDEDDVPPPLPTQIDRRLQRPAQFAFLDHDDGIAL